MTSTPQPMTPPCDRTRPNRGRVTALMNTFGMTPVPHPLRTSNSDALYLQGE